MLGFKKDESSQMKRMLNTWAGVAGHSEEGDSGWMGETEGRHTRGLLQDPQLN